MTTGTGTPWVDQELSEPLIDVIEKVRKGVVGKLVTDGEFRRQDMDHNSDGYFGLSNKQITILAGKLDPSCRDKPFEDKWRVVMRAAFGS